MLLRGHWIGHMSSSHWSNQIPRKTLPSLRLPPKKKRCHLGERARIQIRQAQHSSFAICDCEVGNPFELRIKTTLIINHLPQKEFQSNLVKTLKKFFGEYNIVRVSFGHTPREEKQYGWCHIQCLNATAYIEWVNKSPTSLEGILTS